jgi:hypothetical protein
MCPEVRLLLLELIRIVWLHYCVQIVNTILQPIFYIVEILWNDLHITLCTLGNATLVALIGTNGRITKAVRHLLPLQI